jgi:hypothetical protein
VSVVPRPRRPEHADIELTSRVTAAELTFHEQPRTRVDFFAEPGSEAASGSDRVNLPDEVTENVTYRDVRVDYRLATRLDAPTDQ